MTRWLSEEQKATWRLYLSATRLVEDALDRQLREDSGIPHSYYEVLVRLSSRPDRTIRMSELADLTLSSRSRLSHAVSRLEAMGWVARDACEGDGRGLMARLTDEGFTALEAAAPGHVEEVRARLFDPLDEGQVKALDGICRSLLDQLGHQPASIAAETD